MCANTQALEGKDIVAHARTGSGKTLAYLLPALQAILTGGKGRAGWQALVLVPSRELCEQARSSQSCVQAIPTTCCPDAWDEATAIAQQCDSDLAATSLARSHALRLHSGVCP